MNDNKELDFTTEEKIIDCVQFKRKLQENIWEKSGAKNFDEYIAYVEKSARESKYWKQPLNTQND